MSLDTRIRQNEFFASKNYAYPPPSLELNPVPMVNYVMPPLDDEMFQGYSMSLPSSRPSWTRTFTNDEIHEDEDEGEDEGEEEEDAEGTESPPPPFV
jgi:hypothetical protein